MTEQTEAPDAPEPVQETGAAYAPHSLRDDLSFLRPDPQLESLVAVVNSTSMTMGVTLTVSGLVIIGELIGYGTYWNSLADEVEGWTVGDGAGGEFAGGKVITQELAGMYRRLGEKMDEDEDEDEDEFEPRYAHLRNVVIFSGQQQITASLWRGRLDAVSGWTLVRE